jgi:hypothetical protein
MTPIFLFLSFGLSSFMPSPASTDLVKENLKGELTQVTSYNYLYEEGGKREYLTERQIYDNDGLIVKQEQLTGDEVISVTLFNRSENGALLQKVDTLFHDQFVTYRDYKYDNEGRVVTLYGRPYNDTVLDRLDYKYDEQGNIVEEKLTAANGNVISIIERTYDEQNHLYSRKDYNRNGKVVREYIYQYDRNGNEVARKEYNADHKESVYTTNYVLDRANNWTKKEEYKNGKLQMVTDRYFIYDTKLASGE